MKIHTAFSCLFLTAFFCFSIHAPLDQPLASAEIDSYISFSESLCHTSYGGLVKTYDIKDGASTIGNSIWLERSGSRRVKAKYFAHKESGQSVHQRYDTWRSDKDILLISSGAYATGWKNQDIPVGITVDNGKIVNRKLDDSMDGLVIVEAVGGIRVSNIDDADLKLRSLGNYPMNMANATHKSQFLAWAQSEYATVFQTHLLIYDNELKVGRNGSSSSARRKFLVLATNSSGKLHHIIFYMKNAYYTLYESSSAALRYFRSKNMDVVAAINLDTGGFDILNTGDVYDCSSNRIEGTSNKKRRDLTNMLVYHYE